MRNRNTFAKLSALILALALTAGAALDAAADVRINVNLGPPPVVVAEPPELVMIPGSYVYFVPAYDFDIFFYDGYWWSPRGERWYRSRSYDGPWRSVSRRNVPRQVYRVPKDYREVYVREKHIPYGQWKKDKKYKKHKDRDKRGGKGEHRGRDDDRGRGKHGGDDRGRGDHGGRGDR